MRKSMEETLEEIKKRKQQLDEKRQQLIEKEKLITAKIANTDRRERTRRLIQVAAILEKHLPANSIYDAEAIGEYFDKHPNALAELSQYVSEKSPMIQVQRERENVTTRRNIRGSGSINAKN